MLRTTSSNFEGKYVTDGIPSWMVTGSGMAFDGPYVEYSSYFMFLFISDHCSVIVAVRCGTVFVLPQGLCT